MNAKANTFVRVLATTVIALSLPATATVDPAFMREMAKTDGNPHGDYAVPTMSDYTLSKMDAIERARYEAFVAELGRTDGFVWKPVAETASDTTVARR